MVRATSIKKLSKLRLESKEEFSQKEWEGFFYSVK